MRERTEAGRAREAADVETCRCGVGIGKARQIGREAAVHEDDARRLLRKRELGQQGGGRALGARRSVLADRRQRLLERDAVERAQAGVAPLLVGDRGQSGRPELPRRVLARVDRAGKTTLQTLEPGEETIERGMRGGVGQHLAHAASARILP